MQSLQEMAAQCKRQSLLEKKDDIELFDALLIHGNNGTADLSGADHGRGIQFLNILLLTNAFNNLWMAREAAITGYPAQCMTLSSGVGRLGDDLLGEPASTRHQSLVVGHLRRIRTTSRGDPIV